MPRRAIQTKMRLYTDSNRPSATEGLSMVEPRLQLHRLALPPTSLASPQDRRDPAREASWQLVFLVTVPETSSQEAA